MVLFVFHSTVLGPNAALRITLFNFSFLFQKKKKKNFKYTLTYVESFFVLFYFVVLFVFLMVSTT